MFNSDWFSFGYFFRNNGFFSSILLFKLLEIKNPDPPSGGSGQRPLKAGSELDLRFHVSQALLDGGVQHTQDLLDGIRMRGHERVVLAVGDGDPGGGLLALQVEGVQLQLGIQEPVALRDKVIQIGHPLDLLLDRELLFGGHLSASVSVALAVRLGRGFLVDSCSF